MLKTPVLIISDIHSNSLALKKVLSKVKFNSLIIAGDIVVDDRISMILNNLDIEVLMVRGNCDSPFLFKSTPLPPLFIQDEILLVNKKIKFFLQHGHIDYSKDKIYDLYIQGHTHYPKIEKEDGIFNINPGSISQDRSSLGESFIILDDNFITLYSLYNFSPLKKIALA